MDSHSTKHTESSGLAPVPIDLGAQQHRGNEEGVLVQGLLLVTAAICVQRPALQGLRARERIKTHLVHPSRA